MTAPTEVVDPPAAGGGGDGGGRGGGSGRHAGDGAGDGATATVRTDDQRPRAAEGRAARALPLVQAVALAALAALAGLSFRVAFDPGSLTLPVVATAAVTVGVAVLVDRFGPRRRALTAVVAVVAEVVALLAVAAALTRTSPLTVPADLRDGLARLLTTAVPAAGDGPLLAAPLLVTWAVGGAGYLLARFGRSALLPAAPALVGLVVGLASGDGDLTAYGTGLVAGVVLAAGALLAARTERGRRPGFAAVVAVAAVLVVAAGVGVLVGPSLPAAGTRPPLRLRDHVDPEHAPRDVVNPLALLAAAEREGAAAQAEGRDDPIAFTVDASAPVDRYPLVALDTYDGRQWSSSAVLARAGRRLSAGPALAVPATEVRQHVELAQAPGVWLPAAARPVEVTGTPVLFDDRTATLAVSGLASGRRTYDVVSDVPDESPEAVRSAVPVTGDAAAPYLAVPDDVPPSLRALATQITGKIDSPADQAYAIADHLRSKAKLVLPAQAVPGHSMVRLEQFLTDPRQAQGSPEQFAAAFALLARLDGLPARVVVGYKGNGQAGAQMVHTSDLTAWPEVLFDGIGWVAFDPLPGDAATPPPTPAAGADTPIAGAVTGTPTEEATTGAAEEEPPSFADRALVVLAVVVLVPLVALVVLALVTFVVRRRRRRRRRSGTARRRVLGAWDEAVDALASVGVAAGPSRTASEVVAAVPDDDAADLDGVLVPLAALANEARYGGDEVPDGDAERAWRYARRVEERCAARRSVRRRLARALDPR